MNRQHHYAGLTLGDRKQADESWRDKMLSPGTKILIAEDKPELRSWLRECRRHITPPAMPLN